MKNTIFILFILIFSVVCNAEEFPGIDNVSPPVNHPISGNLLDPHYVVGATNIIRNWLGEQSIVEEEQAIFLNDTNNTKINITINFTA